MRLSTAVTVALTALLVTSMLGMAVVSPSAALESGPDSTVAGNPATPSVADSGDHASVQHPPASIAADGSPLSPADPSQVIRINLTDDGDARWSIETRFLITDDEEEAIFEEYAAEVAAGNRDVGYESSQFNAVVDDAAASTGREMTIEDDGWDQPRIEEAEAEYDDDDVRIGVVSYSFTWTEFSRVDENRIYFEDSLQGSNGSWLDLGDGQRLVVESPSGYFLETPTDLEWDGPHEFEEGELDIIFVQGSQGPVGLSLEYLLAGLVIVVVGGVLLYRVWQSADEEDLPDWLPAPRSPNAEDGSSTLAPTDPDGGQAIPTDRGHVDPADPSHTSVEFDEELDDDVDPELLSDEERVLRMLKRNGGRMKQANIVKETGWSNAKVSQLLSQMDDDDAIEKLRIGRENLITLPEVDPTEID
ncbi:helix-turn-helix transcriptional regulator [Natrarchaeobius sp. A-rgal3]|uniref:helix-turn-helix transcriptional regulator n=1 Tax=Natrarchaeobius versutus TaxID=1679078 RepID=UPI00350ED41E